MFQIDSSLYNRNPEFSDLFEEIEKCLAKISTDAYNERVFGVKGCRRYDFDSLIDYYDILLHKQFCDDCLKEHSLSSIISQIRKITNKIPN